MPHDPISRRTLLQNTSSAALAALLGVRADAGAGAGATERVEWTWQWKPAVGEAPKAEICTFRYGKEWAYAVEIDDGPLSTLTVSQPLLAEYAFTDAPPGVRGGRRMPFVGGAAIIGLRTGTLNNTFLSWDQLRSLRSSGWSVLNHGYWHSGYSWDPKGAITAEQIRRELFWNQAVIAEELGGDAAPAHLVLPNGYTPYSAHLREFGLRSASRVSGASTANTRGGGFKLEDLNRNYLDEGFWAPTKDALAGLPKAPRSGDLIIDFTHGMDGSPESPNNRRWRERLRWLASHFGAGGEDTLWCAPTDEVVSYVLARDAALLRAERGRLTVSVPRGLPGTRLTVRLMGIDPKTRLEAPPGARLYRRDDQVWLTTPLIGKSGAPLAEPRVRRVFRGPVKSLTLEKPQRVAAVRVLQHGKAAPGFALSIDLLHVDKSTSLVQSPIADNWGAWLLYPTVPGGPAPLTDGIRITPDPCLKEMEVWAVTD